MQAVVLDRVTGYKQLATDPKYSGWNADIFNATDYYPFGSPMPGRSTQDTTKQSILVASTMQVQNAEQIDSLYITNYVTPSSTYINAIYDSL